MHQSLGAVLGKFTRNIFLKNNSFQRQKISLLLVCAVMLMTTGCSALENHPIIIPSVTSPESKEIAPTGTIPFKPEIPATQIPTIESESSSAPVGSLDAAITPIAHVDGFDLDSDDGRRLALGELFSRPNTLDLGIPAEIEKKWQAYSKFELDLTIEEKLDLSQFLSLWLQLDELKDRSEYGKEHSIQIKIRSNENSGGRIVLKPYLVAVNDGIEQNILLARDSQGRFSELIPAPEIPDFTKELAEDGWRIAYLDNRGKPMLLADAYPLAEEDIQRIKEKLKQDDASDEDPLMIRLVDEYLNGGGSGSPYIPRFHLPVEGIDVNFVGVERSLSASQIILLNEAFELFNRPQFQALKATLFGGEVWMLFYDDLGPASGMNFTGTGLIMVDRRDLFGNKYVLASVLAHEGSHVLQGGIRKGEERCDELLRMESGDGKIPADFYQLTADQLMEGVRDRTFGAYHVSLWMLSQLGYQNLRNLQQAIQTGTIGGSSVLLDCP